jgi:hypothetical protein
MDLLNTSCQDIVLISEDYCLDKSFDIIFKNFDILSSKLESKQKEVDLYKILKEKYNKNKEKYNKFLTFVDQFSSSLLDVMSAFNTNRDLWSIVNTPMEVIYPTIIYLEDWGTFNQKDGVLTKTTASSNTQKHIEEWINYKFPYGQYGIYEKLNVRIYIQTKIPFTFSFKAEFNEACAASGGTMTICCKPCDMGNDSKGCNRMGPKGSHVCGNMYDYCPSASHSSHCANGQCVGTGGKKLEINRKITLPDDSYLLGNDLLKFEVNETTLLWQKI